MNNSVVRNASLIDVDSICSLLVKRGSIDSEENVKKRLEVILTSSEHLFAVALLDDVMVGYIWIQSYGPHVRAGDITARLHDIFVAPPARRHGLARKLFEFGKEWCVKGRVSYLQWQADAPAIPFYEKLGLKGDTKSDLEEYPFYEIDFTKRAQ